MSSLIQGSREGTFLRRLAPSFAKPERRFWPYASRATSSSFSSANPSKPKILIWTSQVVSNTGSIARDVLAAERTFLAWSRTGLGFVGGGSAMFAAYHRYQIFLNEEERPTGAHRQAIQKKTDQKSNFDTAQFNVADKPTDGRKFIYPASALLVANGAFLLAFATRRYLRTVSLLQNGQFLVDTRGTLIAVMGTALSTVTSLVLVFQEQFVQTAEQGDPARE
jgi:uncharacterized membrane protein YidH (DUF202 family)